MLEFGPAALYILVIGQAGYRGLGAVFRRRASRWTMTLAVFRDQGFVMGDEEHGPGPGPEKILQKLEGLQIQVVGGLVQQQKVRLLPQEPGHLGFTRSPPDSRPRGGPSWAGPLGGSETSEGQLPLAG